MQCDAKIITEKKRLNVLIDFNQNTGVFEQSKCAANLEEKKTIFDAIVLSNMVLQVSRNF